MDVKARPSRLSTEERELVGAGGPQLRVVTVPAEVVSVTEQFRAHAAPIVAIVGLGYVGLPTALAFATGGAPVIGFDVNETRLERILADDVDVVPADHERLKALIGRPELALTTDPARLADADVVLVCVPTPVDPSLAPDLRAIEAACRVVVERATLGQTIILTSTSYVGCTRDFVVRGLAGRGFHPGRDVFVAFSPERIDPGNVDHPQCSVPRVVGGVSLESTRRAAEVLGRIAPIHEVGSLETAEMTKLLENTFRAVNIAMINEFANAASELGVDITEVIIAAATKPYGFMPFYPGPGVGGHCIPCDPHYLLWQLRGARIPMPLITQAMTSIAERPSYVVRRVAEALSDRRLGVRGARVMVVGVTYKPGVADLRESSAIEIIGRLINAGALVSYTDRFIPTLRLPDGTKLESEDLPNGSDFDLVLVHTVHQPAQISWLDGCSLVLDATYRLPAHRRTMLV
jgi:UDP-N-acetyl-D-glucosamine dehydrogenase